MTARPYHPSDRDLQIRDKFLSGSIPIKIAKEIGLSRWAVCLIIQKLAMREDAVRLRVSDWKAPKKPEPKGWKQNFVRCIRRSLMECGYCQCNICKLVLPKNEFGPGVDVHMRSQCRECGRKRHAKWVAGNPSRAAYHAAKAQSSQRYKDYQREWSQKPACEVTCGYCGAPFKATGSVMSQHKNKPGAKFACSVACRGSIARAVKAAK